MKKVLTLVIVVLLLSLFCAACKEEALIICANCSAELSASSRFCSDCGASLTEENDNPTASVPATSDTVVNTTESTTPATEPSTSAPTTPVTEPSTSAPTTPVTEPTQGTVESTESAKHQHFFTSATCTEPGKCQCGKISGSSLGHAWQNATCTTAKTCSRCQKTEGSAIGHTWVNATCTTAKSCSLCGVTEGDVLAHNWIEATCTTPKTCSVCQTSEGDAAGHNYQDGLCAVCGDRQLGYGVWKTIVDFVKSEYDDALAVVPLDFEGKMIGCFEYMHIDIAKTVYDPDTLAEWPKFPYQGEVYIPFGGYGGDIIFEQNQDTFVVYNAFGNSKSASITLRKISKDQAVVTNVVGYTDYCLQEGMIFTYSETGMNELN